MRVTADPGSRDPPSIRVTAYPSQNFYESLIRVTAYPSQLHESHFTGARVAEPHGPVPDSRARRGPRAPLRAAP